MTITKELFIESIEEIEAQHRHDQKCSQAFKVLIPNDYTSCYDNHWLYNRIIKLLQIAMKDENENSCIDYYCWEIDFGKKWEKGSVKIEGKDFKLKTSSDLWELLTN